MSKNTFSSESKSIVDDSASSSKSSNCKTWENCIARATSCVRRKGKNPPLGMSQEDFIYLVARQIAFREKIPPPPEDEDRKPYMRGKGRDESYIDAAFRSIRTNEVFIFTGFHYFVVNSNAPSHSQKEKSNPVTKDPLLLIDGFPELYGTAFRDAGVDAAFGCHGTDEAYLFSGYWTARIKYDSNNEGQVLLLACKPGLVFPCLKDTKFSEGFFDAACESTVPFQAYFFKGSDFALVNYSKGMLIREGRIADEFTCLRNTVFESEIGSAFASHTSNQLYFFKDNTYVLIEFYSETRESLIIAGPKEILPTNWPCLKGLLPYKRDANPYSRKPKTWKTVFVDGRFERAPLNAVLERPPASALANLLLERNGSRTMISGRSPKRMKTVECQSDMQRRPRYSSHFIDSAFRSTWFDEVFMFIGSEYFVVKYDVDSQKFKNVTKGPLSLTDGFKGLHGTRFHNDGVDAAFGCHGTDTAFLFSGSWIALINYELNNEGRVVQLAEVEGMRGSFIFLGLEDTKFSQGYLDAACESTVPGEAYLFKDSDYALIDYSSEKLTLIRKGRITDEFSCLHNTLFESEIGSAFASPTPNRLYFFKGDTYVLIEFDSKTKKSCIIAGPMEIVPTDWPLLEEGLVPFEKGIGPGSDYDRFVPGPNELSLEYPCPFCLAPIGV